MDADEEDPERMDHPFLAPFSWIVVFVVGALFWYWIVGLLLGCGVQQQVPASWQSINYLYI